MRYLNDRRFVIVGPDVDMIAAPYFPTDPVPLHLVAKLVLSAEEPMENHSYRIDFASHSRLLKEARPIHDRDAEIDFRRSLHGAEFERIEAMTPPLEDIDLLAITPPREWLDEEQWSS